MPLRACSRAIVRISPSKAPLAAAYAADPGALASGPVTDETITTRPASHSTMSGSTACVRWKAVFSVISSWRCSAVGGRARNSPAPSSSLPLWVMPALLMSAFTGPCAARAAATSAAACSGSVRSATKENASASSTARSRIRSVVDVIETRAPSCASNRALAKPIPSRLPQPLTSTWRPSNRKGAPMRTAYAPPGDVPSTWTETTVRVRERPNCDRWHDHRERSNESALLSPARELVTRGELELAKHARHVGLHGLDRKMETGGDLFVAVAARDQLQHLALAGRQIVEL